MNYALYNYEAFQQVSLYRIGVVKLALLYVIGANHRRLLLGPVITRHDNVSTTSQRTSCIAPYGATPYKGLHCAHHLPDIRRVGLQPRCTPMRPHLRLLPMERGDLRHSPRSLADTPRPEGREAGDTPRRLKEILERAYVELQSYSMGVRGPCIAGGTP
jgi:hypothetical protein